MTIGEVRVRYRVYDPSDALWASKNGGWTNQSAMIATFDEHGAAFKHAHRLAGRAFEAGEVVIQHVRFRRVPSQTARELARVSIELAAMSAQNDRLADALRRALTTEITQTAKANLMRWAMGREPLKEDAPADTRGQTGGHGLTAEEMNGGLR